jgi:hypothetical protein
MCFSSRACRCVRCCVRSSARLSAIRQRTGRHKYDSAAATRRRTRRRGNSTLLRRRPRSRAAAGQAALCPLQAEQDRPQHGSCTSRCLRCGAASPASVAGGGQWRLRAATRAAARDGGRRRRGRLSLQLAASAACAVPLQYARPRSVVRFLHTKTGPLAVDVVLRLSRRAQRTVHLDAAPTAAAAAAARAGLTAAPTPARAISRAGPVRAGAHRRPSL